MADILSSLKHELQILETRRLDLSHELATLHSTHTVPASSNTTFPADDAGLLTNLFTRTRNSDLKSLEKLHRLAGITLFIPNNPNEGSISQDDKSDEFLGIRFETVQDGKFELPHYVILKKSFDGNVEYILHRHTIPSFIPVAGLCEEFLGNGSGDLEQFALTLHRHLILLSNRAAIVTRLQKVKGAKEVKTDEAARLVELTTAQWNARIILQDQGERIVVVDHENERLKEVEKEILGTKNNNEDIVTRIARIL